MNIIIGTILEFDESIFIGSFRKPKFSHTATHTVEVINESYGSKRGQHSFTLKVIDSTEKSVGEVFRKLGRNIYPTARIISQPENEAEIAKEKAIRSQDAKENKYFQWLYEAQFEGKQWKLERIPNWFKEKYSEQFNLLLA